MAIKKAPTKTDGDLVQVTVRLPRRLHEALADQRDNHGVSIQHSVTKAVEEYLAKKR